jgi:pyruvate dehydrogenase (quinone)
MPGPTLADQPITDPDALSVPLHLTAAQVKGFALAAGKVVLDGGVGNMLELARANVRNVPVPTGRR